MDRILVSVCVITFNQVHYIEKCLESILSQKTNFDYEIVLGDDGSTDGTTEICLKYASLHPTIKLFERKIQAGSHSSANRNFFLTLGQCQGKYIAICEGDDYWTDTKKLQKQVDFLELNDDYSICFHSVKLLLRNGKIVEDFITKEVEETTTFEDLAKGNFIHTPSIVFRNQFVNANLPEILKKIQLCDFFLHLYNAQYGKIYKIKECMAIYRYGIGLWSKLDVTHRVKITMETYTQMINYFELPSQKELFYNSFVQMAKSFLVNEDPLLIGYVENCIEEIDSRTITAIMQQNFVEQDLEIENMTIQADILSTELSGYREELHKNEEELQKYRKELGGYREELHKNEEELQKYRKELFENREELHQIKLELIQLNGNNLSLKKKQLELAQKLNATKNSLSWKLTYPFRLFGTIFH